MDTLNFLKWPSIKSFKDMTFNMNKLWLGTEEELYLHMRPKFKLHGTNAAIRVYLPTGIVAAMDNQAPIKNNRQHIINNLDEPVITCQKRNGVVSVADDNYGFANWVNNNYDLILDNFRYYQNDIDLGAYCFTFFGEWAGQGINSGDAINQAPTGFHIFTLVVQNLEGDIISIITEPEYIQKYTYKITEELTQQQFNVIPWAGKELIFICHDISKNEPEINHINKLIGFCDDRCEYTKKIYDIDGPGEGLVYYMTGLSGSKDAIMRFRKTQGNSSILSWYGSWMFKAKTLKHRTSVSAKAVTVDPVVVATNSEFVRTHCTEARLTQGAEEVNGADGFTPRNISAFLKWIGQDVFKETEVERGESEIDWKTCSKALSKYASAWYINKC